MKTSIWIRSLLFMLTTMYKGKNKFNYFTRDSFYHRKKPMGQFLYLKASNGEGETKNEFSFNEEAMKKALLAAQNVKTYDDVRQFFRDHKNGIEPEEPKGLANTGTGDGVVDESPVTPEQLPKVLEVPEVPSNVPTDLNKYLSTTSRNKVNFKLSRSPLSARSNQFSMRKGTISWYHNYKITYFNKDKAIVDKPTNALSSFIREKQIFNLFSKGNRLRLTDLNNIGLQKAKILQKPVFVEYFKEERIIKIPSFGAYSNLQNKGTHRVKKSVMQQVSDNNLTSFEKMNSIGDYQRTYGIVQKFGGLVTQHFVHRNVARVNLTISNENRCSVDFAPIGNTRTEINQALNNQISSRNVIFGLGNSMSNAVKLAHFLSYRHLPVYATTGLKNDYVLNNLRSQSNLCLNNIVVYTDKVAEARALFNSLNSSYWLDLRNVSDIIDFFSDYTGKDIFDQMLREEVILNLTQCNLEVEEVSSHVMELPTYLGLVDFVYEGDLNYVDVFSITSYQFFDSIIFKCTDIVQLITNLVIDEMQQATPATMMDNPNYVLDIYDSVVQNLDSNFDHHDFSYFIKTFTGVMDVTFFYARLKKAVLDYIMKGIIFSSVDGDTVVNTSIPRSIYQYLYAETIMENTLGMVLNKNTLIEFNAKDGKHLIGNRLVGEFIMNFDLGITTNDTKEYQFNSWYIYGTCERENMLVKQMRLYKYFNLEFYLNVSYLHTDFSTVTDTVSEQILSRVGIPVEESVDSDDDDDGYIYGVRSLDEKTLLEADTKQQNAGESETEDIIHEESEIGETGWLKPDVLKTTVDVKPQKIETVVHKEVGGKKPTEYYESTVWKEKNTLQPVNIKTGELVKLENPEESSGEEDKGKTTREAVEVTTEIVEIEGVKCIRTISDYGYRRDVSVTPIVQKSAETIEAERVLSEWNSQLEASLRLRESPPDYTIIKQLNQVDPYTNQKLLTTMDVKIGAAIDVNRHMPSGAKFIFPLIKKAHDEKNNYALKVFIKAGIRLGWLQPIDEDPNIYDDSNVKFVEDVNKFMDMCQKYIQNLRNTQQVKDGYVVNWIAIQPTNLTTHNLWVSVNDLDPLSWHELNLNGLAFVDKMGVNAVQYLQSKVSGKKVQKLDDIKINYVLVIRILFASYLSIGLFKDYNKMSLSGFERYIHIMTQFKKSFIFKEIIPLCEFFANEGATLTSFNRATYEKWDNLNRSLFHFNLIYKEMFCPLFEENDPKNQGLVSMIEGKTVDI